VPPILLLYALIFIEKKKTVVEICLLLYYMYKPRSNLNTAVRGIKMVIRKDDASTDAGLLKNIDKDSYEPAYMQLVNIIKKQIAHGIFRPGDQLPSESQLCKQHQVSPMTVRRAINILIDQGIASTVQGRGTFVSSISLGSAAFHLKGMQDFFMDEKTTVKILEARIVAAEDRAAKKLEVRLKKPLIFIRRLLLKGEEPFFYHKEFLIYDPTRPIVESELEVTSLQGLFNGSGSSEFKHGELSIEATVITTEEATVLKSDVGFPAFCLEHIFYDFDKKPVSWGWFICRGDKLRFTTTVGVWEKV
jgi:DNA-binding GntR family transcriptional regulator